MKYSSIMTKFIRRSAALWWPTSLTLPEMQYGKWRVFFHAKFMMQEVFIAPNKDEINV